MRGAVICISARDPLAYRLRNSSMSNREKDMTTKTLAYALIGGAKPAAAAGHAQQGGTLRMEMEVRALKDPRSQRRRHQIHVERAARRQME